MGKYKYKFRLSDMVPNAWFYKLRDMSHSTRRSSRNLQNFSTRGGNSGLVARRSSFASLASSSPRVSFVPNRASYYYSSNSTSSTAAIESRRSLSSTVNLARRIDADLPLETPRKSNKRRRRRHVKVLINSPGRKSVSPSSSIQCNCSGGGGDGHENCVTEGCESFVSDSEKETVLADFITDTDTKRSDCKKLAGNRNASSNMIELALSPIRTRSADKECKDVDRSFYTDDKKSYFKTKSRSASSKAVHPNRTRLVASPKAATKTATKARKSINRSQKKSLAVIKYSSDPHRDFTESMIEMIIANDMRSSGDLEDLLACYLSLNSADYHSVIVKVFKQVWLDLNRLQFIE